MDFIELLYRFAQSERLQFRSARPNWFDDHQGVVGGFQLSLRCLLLSLAPVASHSYSVDLGEIGKAGLFHFPPTAGEMHKCWELDTAT